MESRLGKYSPQVSIQNVNYSSARSEMHQELKEMSKARAATGMSQGKLEYLRKPFCGTPLVVVSVATKPVETLIITW